MLLWLGCAIYAQPVLAPQTRPIPNGATYGPYVREKVCRLEIDALEGIGGAIAVTMEDQKAQALVDVSVDRYWLLPFPSRHGCVIVRGQVVTWPGDVPDRFPDITRHNWDDF